jgi:protein-L-isoaspartate(D-aspartate) O-methyltransferase
MGALFQKNSSEQKREAMVRVQLADRGISDARVLEAMGRVPREKFIPEAFRENAYDDRPLPIGQDQTISQPYIVAVMLQHLALQATDRVLEVGTGSGYATALLSLLCAEVFSIERHAQLAASAEKTLRDLEYRNVKITIGDGRNGWDAHSPYDAILVSAATAEIPPKLFAQLREGGRMMLPVGPPEGQKLQLICKINGRPDVKIFEGCRFVPLVDDFGVTL